jgi:hypothetical protein
MKKAATGGHGQAPLFRGARYAGLTLRQSQGAFSYLSTPQNWQAILESNTGKQFLGIFQGDPPKWIDGISGAP